MTDESIEMLKEEIVHVSAMLYVAQREGRPHTNKQAYWEAAVARYLDATSPNWLSRAQERA